MKEEHNKREAMLRQFELVERVQAYDSALDEVLLNKAYVFSMKAHGSQLRASGDPFFSHPVEVAGILTTYHFDHVTIIAALLHDVVECTTATLHDVANLFGEKVAMLVDGVTKISKLTFSSESQQQAENFRKLVVAMANDIRVLFVRLADRQHNMQTLRYIKSPLKRRRIAQETIDVYAPLAGRVGVQQMKELLEDLAFREINKTAYEATSNRLRFLCAPGDQAIDEISTELRELLRKAGINARVFGRVKTPYSVWKKMESRNATFEQLCDIIAFRVVVQTLAECYQALGVLHNSFAIMQGRFKDYISTPKLNNYQALHTTIISSKHKRVEIQVKTEEMDLTAEFGIAAHWQYKQGVDTYDGMRYNWVRDLLQTLEQTNNPEEFLENAKMEMYQDQVFCFTTNGELLSLPSGVSVIDFAYAVGQDVGDHLCEATINGKLVPLHTILQNGDQIGLITDEGQCPQTFWEEYVCTGRAKARIRKMITTQQLAGNMEEERIPALHHIKS